MLKSSEITRPIESTKRRYQELLGRAGGERWHALSTARDGQRDSPHSTAPIATIWECASQSNSLLVDLPRPALRETDHLYRFGYRRTLVHYYYVTVRAQP